MSQRIPEGAFDFYVGLGSGRSYETVAQNFGVSKRAITKLAARAEWPLRLEKIEREAREKSEKKLVETLEEMNERHLRIVKAVQGRALEALKAMPLSTGMEAVRALELSIRQERLIRGEPTDRNETSIAETVERESRRWLTVIKEEASEEEGSNRPDEGDADEEE